MYNPTPWKDHVTNPSNCFNITKNDDGTYQITRAGTARVCDFAENLKPSPRGELEITDLNRCYLDDGSLQLEKMGRGYAWLDTGTHESLVEASTYIETIEKRQGLRVCCPEEIAFHNGWIDAAQVEKLAAPLAKNGYGQYLLSLVSRGVVR